VADEDADDSVGEDEDGDGVPDVYQRPSAQG
jgi:hypothetical protein